MVPFLLLSSYKTTCAVQAARGRFQKAKDWRMGGVSALFVGREKIFNYASDAVVQKTRDSQSYNQSYLAHSLVLFFSLPLSLSFCLSFLSFVLFASCLFGWAALLYFYFLGLRSGIISLAEPVLAVESGSCALYCVAAATRLRHPLPTASTRACFLTAFFHFCMFVNKSLILN